MQDPHTPARPLQGIRVLDLTSVLAGPYATQIMGDYGADIVKVEAPGGDSTRKTGPTTEAGMGALFIGTNRCKRSIVLDLKQDSARAALLRLVDDADVLIHAMRPQKLTGLGLGPDVLMARSNWRPANSRCRSASSLGSPCRCSIGAENSSSCRPV